MNTTAIATPLLHKPGFWAIFSPTADRFRENLREQDIPKTSTGPFIMLTNPRSGGSTPSLTNRRFTLSMRTMPARCLVKRQVMPQLEHRSYKSLNNRAENSHVPLRKRERAMQGFPSSGSLRRFISIFSAVRNLPTPTRSQRSALGIGSHRLQALAEWHTVTIGS